MRQARFTSSAVRLGFGFVVAVLLAGVLASPTLARGPDGSADSEAITIAPCDNACLAMKLRGDLKAYLKANGSADQISEAGLTVRLRNGRTINVAAGTMSVGGTRPARSSTVWQVGSNTKAFTSVILLQLEAEGRLSINDTVGKWLPQYKRWRGVTIKRLLHMDSGIPTYDDTVVWGRAYVKNPHRNFSRRQLVDYAKTGKPTQGYSYSNTNYILGEMIIEKVTHDSYSSQFQRRIIRPLHLNSLYYQPDKYPASVTRREPAGYFFNRQDQPTGVLSALLKRDVSRDSLSWAQGAGGIISTTHDMTVWEHAL